MRILIFGATGSIGQSTIELIKKYSRRYHLVGISYFHNCKLAYKIKKQFNLRNNQVFCSLNKDDNQINNFIKVNKPDIIVNAISGLNGLKYTMLSIENKIDIALANKESLVSAGKFIMQLAQKNKVHIYPIDSEHSSLSYLLNVNKKNSIKHLMITGSGGPFFHYSANQLKSVSYNDAINHPNWKMGNKISIDSSTLINKAFELVEAYWLFPKYKTVAINDPFSQIHSGIIYKNDTGIVFKSKPDMKMFIEMALNKFKCLKKFDKHIEFLDLNEVHTLLSNSLFHNYLLGLNYAKLIIENINTAIPPIICIADEISINKFKNNEIKFLQIYTFIDKLVNSYKSFNIKSPSDIFNLYWLINSSLKK